MPVTQVRGLGVTKVDSETFGGTVTTMLCFLITDSVRVEFVTYKPIARAKLTIPSSVRTAGELFPEIMTYKVEKLTREDRLVATENSR